MSFFALGDYHGHPLKDFREEEDIEEIDKLASTGDFDRVETIHEYLDLREKVGEHRTVEVGGNHDDALLNRRPLLSGTVREQDASWTEMVEELQKDPVAERYLEDLLETPAKEFQMGELNGLLVHGGLAGHLQDPELEEEYRPFWYRLWEEEDFLQNFEAMEAKGYDLIIRGHDHWTEHAFRQKDASREGKVNYHLPDPGDEYSLDPDYTHIITHGPWFDGHYLKMDEEELRIRFKKV